MLAFAALGLVANIVGLLLLRRGAKESLNVRGAYLEVLGDALGSVAVIVAGLVIVTTGWWRADVVASIAVALLILPRTWSLLKAAVDVLLESTPTDLTMDEVREHILGVDGVEAVHDLHAWTLTSGMPVLSAHVIVDDAVLAEGRSSDVLAALNECLHDHFDVKHCTFQLEPHHFGAQESLTHR
jgi:cobalt-zinc-cadmium efflux system protein